MYYRVAPAMFAASVFFTPVSSSYAEEAEHVAPIKEFVLSESYAFVV